MNYNWVDIQYNQYTDIQSIIFTIMDNYLLLKPSLSMKTLSINNFTIELLNKLLSDLYIGVHLKGTKKFGSKVINRQCFHRKTGL